MNHTKLHIPQSWVLKVNDLIHNVANMNISATQAQLSICEEIVHQILHDDLLIHLNSTYNMKLLIYEFVLLLAERQSHQFQRITKEGSGRFESGRKPNLSFIDQTLNEINNILEEIMRKYGKKNSSTQAIFGKNSSFYHYFAQFRSQLQYFQTQAQNQQCTLLSSNSPSKYTEEDEGNQALIEQLEEIIAKKEKRIKELNDEIEQGILQQKSMEQLIEQLEIKSAESNNQIEGLRNKISQQDKNTIFLQNRIQELLKEKKILDRELERKNRGKIETQKTMLPIQDIDDSLSKRHGHLLDYSSSKKKQIQESSTNLIENIDEMRKMLFIQCLSIEAMIQS